jgi:hypothetical protein
MPGIWRANIYYFDVEALGIECGIKFALLLVLNWNCSEILYAQPRLHRRALACNNNKY